MLKKKDGFTLLETVVAVAITAVMTAVLFTVFLSVNRTYRGIVEANLMQSRAVSALDFIKESVKNCDQIEIIEEPGQNEKISAIWCKDNKLYYKTLDMDKTVYMENTGFTVGFSGEGNLLRIKLQVLTDGEPYTIESAIALQNVGLVRGGGSGIIFKTATDTDG